MPFPTKIAAAVVAPLLGLAVVWAVWPRSDSAAADAAAVSEAATSVEDAAPATALLRFARPGREAFEVFGPCYQDTRGNDTVLSSTESAQGDCLVLHQGGQDLLDLSGRGAERPVYLRVAGKERSSQTVTLPPADNVVELDGTFDVRLQGVLGTSTVLSMPGVSTVDMRMRQEGTDVIIETIQGRVVLLNQTGGTGEEGFISHILLRGGGIIERSQIRVQSVVAQGTPGNDLIRDTDSDDVIYPGLGDDHITLLGGENRVHYEGGNDRIVSAGETEAFNRVFIPLARAEAAVYPSEDGRDILIESPLGQLRLELQLFYPLGDRRVPVQEVNFTDGPVDEEGLRFLAETYRDSLTEEAVSDRTRLRN